MTASIAECNCNYCAHAAVCPNRDIFMKFFENRDKIMVKCGNDDGSVDTSKQVSIRVEHRYLDGPALEKIYRDLNLGHTGLLPCLAAYGICCPIKQPFDSPIYGRYPNAIGYIDNLCHNARDAAGNRIPFVAPPAPARTNEVHASPFTTTYPGLSNQYWNCGGCAYADQCGNGFDPNKLGGTVFSTFEVDYLDVNIGDIVSIDSIPMPETIAPYYERAEGDCNQPTFTIEDETTLIIIYYAYVGKPPMPVPSYDSLDTLKEQGKVHTMNFFYGPRSYVYPSLSSATIVQMRTVMLGVVAGLGRVDSTGKVLASPGQIIPFRQNGKGILKLDYENAYAPDDNSIAMRNYQNPIDVSSVDFQTCDELVEGDTIIISFTFVKKWLLDVPMMRVLNFGKLIEYQNSQYINGDHALNYLTTLVSSEDFTIQTCLSDRNKAMDQVNYPVIAYEDYWLTDEVHWGLRPVATTQGDQIVMVDQPIPPRKWSKFVVTDNMPYYATDCPPDDTCIVRPGFTLLGYTDDGTARQSFDEDMPIFSAEEMEYNILQTNDGLDIQANNEDILSVHKEPTLTYKYAQGRLYQEKDGDDADLIISEARFLDTGENADNIAWAIWELDFEELLQNIEQRYQGTLSPSEKHGCEIVIADLASDPNETGSDAEPMLSIQQPISLELTMEYKPNQAMNLKELLGSIDITPNNFQYRLYRIPANASKITLWNTWPENELSTDHAPHGTFLCGDDEEILFSTMEVRDDSEMDWKSLDALESEYILIVEPEHVYGMSSLYQNYVPYHLFLSATKVKTTLTLVFDGSKMEYSSCINIDNGSLRGYELSNIYPEDAGLVAINVESLPMVELTGVRSQFYELERVVNRRCEQHLKYSAIYDNMRDNDESFELAVGTGSQMSMLISPENPKHSVLKILFKSASNETPFTLYIVENGEITINTMNNDGETKGYVTVDQNGKISLYLFDIKEDGEIMVTLHNGDDGSVVGCSRCRGYVDTSEYEFIKWMPYCTDFTAV